MTKIPIFNVGELMTTLQESNRVQTKRENVTREESVANEYADAAQELKTECENDLAEAVPILEEATRCLDILKPSDITIIKSMKNPPIGSVSSNSSLSAIDMILKQTFGLKSALKFHLGSISC